jgi:hypothetical protein
MEMLGTGCLLLPSLRPYAARCYNSPFAGTGLALLGVLPLRLLLASNWFCGPYGC